jgi:voltage-gated potassium channel
MLVKQLFNPLRELVAHLDEIETPIGRSLNLAIAALVLCSSVIFVAETYPLSDRFRTILDTVDSIILVAFAIEYFLRFLIAEKKLHHLFSLYALIDLLAILPLLLGIADVRFLRIFRWFRILRLIRFLRRDTLFGYISTEDGLILARIAFTLVSIIFVYSGLIYQVEHRSNPLAFTTFLDAVYFSVVTMTTVGFGDVTPTSQLGRLLAVLMILTGIALIPWQIGDLIRQVVKTANEVKNPCPNCGLTFHDPDARFCKACGTALLVTDRQPRA